MKQSKIFKLLALASQTPIYLASFFIKRDINTWVFSSWEGKQYNDNSKYLFEYIVNNKTDIKAVWITKDKRILKVLKKNNRPVLYCYSPLGLYTQLKAGACFFTQFPNSDFLGAAVINKSLLVQLWHGMPLKKILLDDSDYLRYQKSLVNRILILFFPWSRHKWDLVVSPSKKAEKEFRSAFGSHPIIINSGYPRNENLLKSSSNTINESIENIIYMPTFRKKADNSKGNDFIESYLINNGFDFVYINQICSDNDINFYIKLHPSELPEYKLKNYIDSLSNIHILNNEFDFYEEAQNFDLLITDYSSVFFDFLLTGKPILHVAFDLQDYIANSRELYVNYENIKVGDDFQNWIEVFDYILSTDRKYITQLKNYKNSLDIMQNPAANQSCSTIYHEVKKTLNM